MRQTQSKLLIRNSNKIVQNEGIFIHKIISDATVHEEFSSVNFNTILEFSAVTLSAQQVFRTNLLANQFAIILPIIGGVELLNQEVKFAFIGTDEIGFMAKIDNLDIFNPFKSETIHIIFLKLENNFRKIPQSNKRKIVFKPEAMASFFYSKFLNLKLSIGQFNARQESKLLNLKKKNIELIYNISGAFEVDNKLLETNDAVLLTDIEDFEFEALTNQSILLVIEC
ncbi:MAG: hypothetical protein V4683_17710 [Bacteroidota bacterium]